jgi:predicted site-specific integrase-resolvase
VPELWSDDEEDIDEPEKQADSVPHEEHTSIVEEQTTTALVLYASPSVARRSVELNIWIRIVCIQISKWVCDTNCDIGSDLVSRRSNTTSQRA